MQKQKLIIFLTLLIEVLGISIIIPAFPEFIKYYGVGDFEITLGLTIYSLCAFLAAPIMGQWSDRIGRKTSLAWCILGTSLSYFIMLIQPWYWIFLIARAINGITGGNISIIQAILTDISPDQATKNKHFGLMGAFFGIGFIIGPVLGSIMLSFGGIPMIFWCGGILALLQGGLLLRQFDNTNTTELVTQKRFQYNPLRTIKKFISRPALKPWLWSFLLMGIGGFIVNAGQSLYMNSHFGTSGIKYGYYLAVLGVIAGINMAVLVPKFWTKYFSVKTLFYISFSVLIIGFLLVSSMITELAYISTFYLVILLGGMYGVLYNVEVMSQAQQGEVGELSGMFGSLQSLTMVIGPIIAGVLLESQFDMHRGSVVFFIGAAIVLLPHLHSLDTQTR